MFRATMFTLTLIATANPGLADEVTDTLSAAMQAYEDGDIDYAIEELDYARQLLQDLSAQTLTGFLPEPPAGWSREISDAGKNAGLALFGGGVAAEAVYTDGSASFTLALMADNPMVAGFAPMIASAGMLGLKMHRVAREKFYENDGQLIGLIDNRILIQAEGAAPETMIPVLEKIDFAALGGFGG